MWCSKQEYDEYVADLRFFTLANDIAGWDRLSSIASASEHALRVSTIAHIIVFLYASLCSALAYAYALDFAPM